MKSMVKGGIWKNSEDEILKAAVMKYGLNNWARIASLLTRKTPAQCKARWYEWLDPAVKKTEWTREEDEKLLHLSKIFPTQWRTIAPIVGRTAHQCQERYDKLLDEAQGRGENLDDHDPRRLRPGEVDPNPEIRPAKADAVDMDDDEKQMLQEARARLANVRGKKAMRKAREEMMSETKRQVELQKDRELRAAGVAAPAKKLKRGEIDYNKEIPFETMPLVGNHAFGSEETPRPHISLEGLSAQKLEGMNRAQEETQKRKEDKEKLKKKREAETAEQLLARAEQEMVDSRKINRLVLPDLDEDEDMESESEAEDHGSAAESTNHVHLKASQLLRQLPTVENEVEIEAPDVEDLSEDEEIVPDKGEAMITGQDVEEERFLVSQVVLRNLPRPSLKRFEKASENESDASRMIREEALKLAATDAIEHPVKGHRPVASAPRADRKKYSLEEIKAATAKIAEMAAQLPPVDVSSIQIPETPFTQDAEQKLRKLVDAKAAKITDLHNTARALLGPYEAEISSIAAEMESISKELALVRRRKRIIESNIPKDEARWNAHLAEMSDKLRSEKLKNKQIQDKYLRLSSFMKQLSNIR